MVHSEGEAPIVQARSGFKGVSRVDNPKRKAHGWYVRVSFEGRIYGRFLSDSVHGGQQAGLRKAVAARNELERDLGKPRTDRMVMTVSPRNTTGVVGVQRTLKEGRDVFEVTWNPRPNVVSRTSISVQKYGEAEAFRRACAIRKQKEKGVYGNDLSTAQRKSRRAHEAKSVVPAAMPPMPDADAPRTFDEMAGL